jgi:uncharacterized HAD superfamily protein
LETCKRDQCEQDLYKNQTCKDTERQNVLPNFTQKRSLIFYSEKKRDWARECTACCARNERSALVWREIGYLEAERDEKRGEMSSM